VVSMRKTIILSAIMVTGIVTVLAFNLPTNKVLSSDNGVNQSTAINNSDKEIVQYIDISADFAKSYDNLDELATESDLVAYGTIENMDSFVNEYRRIYTNCELQIEDILKGEISDNATTISVRIEGGKVKYEEYLKASEDYLKVKLGEDEFNSIQYWIQLLILTNT